MVFLWPGLPKKIWEFWAPSRPLQRKPQGRLRCFPAGVLLSKIPWGGLWENLRCKHRTLRPARHPLAKPPRRTSPESGRTRVGCAEPFLHPWKHPTERSRNGSKTVRIFEKGSKRVRKGFENGSNFRKGFEKGSKRVRKRFENGSRPFSEPFWNPFWIEFSKRVRKRFENGSNFRKGFEKGSKTVRKRFENGSRPFSEPFWNPFWMPRVTCQEPFLNLYGEPFQNRFRTLSRSRVGFSEPSPSCCRCFLDVLVGLGPMLSGSHRSTHNASDFASRVLASQARPQRESESQAFRIARS